MLPKMLPGDTFYSQTRQRLSDLATMYLRLSNIGTLKPEDMYDGGSIMLRVGFAAGSAGALHSDSHNEFFVVVVGFFLEYKYLRVSMTQRKGVCWWLVLDSYKKFEKRRPVMNKSKA